MSATANQPTSLQSVLAGSIAGMTSLSVVQPFDFIRTRLQTTTKAQYSGAIDCIRKSFAEGGPLVFYKGMSLPFMAQGLYKAVMFATFNNASQFVLKRSNSNQLTLPQLFLCGATAGLVNSFVVTPVELVRNKLIVHRYSAGGKDQSIPSKIGPLQVIRDTVQKEGMLGMWRGQSATLLRDMIGVGCFYTANNRMMRYLRENTDLSPTMVNILGGMAAGVGFWSVALPMDRVKSIIQTNRQSSTNVGQVLRTILQQDGLTGLYRGWSVAFTRGIPSATIVFTTYNTIMDRMLARSKAAAEASSLPATLVKAKGGL